MLNRQKSHDWELDADCCTAHILERTNISAGVLNRQKNHDWELDADYCAAHGVCDGIIESLDEII